MADEPLTILWSEGFTSILKSPSDVASVKRNERELLVPLVVVTFTLYVSGDKEGTVILISVSFQEFILAVLEPKFT